MFPIERQQKLDPILAKLRSIQGIESVTQDDFDSYGINVFFLLTASKENEGAVMEFVLPLAKLGRTLNKMDMDWRVIDIPKMRYEWIPLAERDGGPMHRKLGYDSQRMGIEIIV
jgi:hypothetical protein